MVFDLGTFPYIEWTSDDSLINSATTVRKTITIDTEPTDTGGIGLIIFSITTILSMIAIVVIRKRK